MIISTALAALSLLLAGTVPPTEPTSASVPRPIPEGYTAIVDSTNSIVVAVPDHWTEVDIAPSSIADGSEVPFIAAAPVLSEFYAFTAPGVLYAAYPYILNPLDYLVQFGLSEHCETSEVKTYDDPVFVGIIQIGANCGAQAMIWNMVVASPADHTFTAIVIVQSPDPVEVETVRLTFNIAPA